MGQKDRTESTDVEVTPEMIEAGVEAYLARASHDELSFSTPEEVVESVIRANLSAQTAKRCGCLVRQDPDMPAPDC